MRFGYKLTSIAVRGWSSISMLWGDKLLNLENSIAANNSWLPPAWVHQFVMCVDWLQSNVEVNK